MNERKKKSPESKGMLFQRMRIFWEKRKQSLKKMQIFDKKYRKSLIHCVIIITLFMVLALFYMKNFSYSCNGRFNQRGYQLPWDEKILVLDHSESILLNEANHRILPPGPAYDYLSLDVIRRIDLREYSAILIPSHYFDFENYYDPNCITKINNYVRNGGSLIVLLHYNYDWLEKPIKFEKKYITSVNLGDLNHSYFKEIKKNSKTMLKLIHRVENIKGLQVGDGLA